MTIAEQISRAKTDYDDVYVAGYEKGKTEGGDTEKAYNNGFEAGKKAEYDAFWDIFQQNGNRRNYNRAFFSETMAQSGWNDTNYNPKYPIITDVGTQTFWCNLFTDTKVPITLRNGAPAQMIFGSCTKLVTIRKLILEGTVSTWANAFVSCISLKNIVIEGVIGADFDIKGSPLTKESITGIISALSPTVSGKTVTFKKTAVDNAFGSSESEEWLALRATKSNWTISLA